MKNTIKVLLTGILLATVFSLCGCNHDQTNKKAFFGKWQGIDISWGYEFRRDFTYSQFDGGQEIAKGIYLTTNKQISMTENEGYNFSTEIWEPANNVYTYEYEILDNGNIHLWNNEDDFTLKKE